MAYGSDKIKNQKINEENPNSEENTQETSNLEFLNPTKDAYKDSFNDPYQAEITKKTAHQYTLKTLNALKIASPLIVALMNRPGVDASNEQILEGFRHLIKEISLIASQVCEKMEVDPTKEKNYWIKNVLEKTFAEILKEQWTNQGKTNIEQLSQLLDPILEFKANVSEKSEYEEVSENHLVLMSNMRAMMPIIKEATSHFDLLRDLSKDMEPILTRLFNASAKAVEKLADDYANAQDRSKLFYMVMQEAGSLYSCAWHAEGLRIQDIMKNQDQSKIQAHLERYKVKGGFPLEKIDVDFEKYFEKMIVITEKLVSTNKSGLDKKLKNKNS